MTLLTVSTTVTICSLPFWDVKDLCPSAKPTLGRSHEAPGTHSEPEAGYSTTAKDTKCSKIIKIIIFWAGTRAGFPWLPTQPLSTAWAGGTGSRKVWLRAAAALVLKAQPGLGHGWRLGAKVPAPLGVGSSAQEASRCASPCPVALSCSAALQCSVLRCFPLQQQDLRPPPCSTSPKNLPFPSLPPQEVIRWQPGIFLGMLHLVFMSQCHPQGSSLAPLWQPRSCCPRPKRGRSRPLPSPLPNMTTLQLSSLPLNLPW